MKRLFFGLLGAFIALSLLVALVLFFPPAFKLGLRTANRFLPLTVELETYHHVPGRLSVSGLRVVTSPATRLEMTGLGVRYRPFALLLGRIELSALELENPRITLEPSLDDPKEEGKEGTEETGSWVSVLAPLSVEEARIDGGSVRFEDPASGLVLTWKGLDMEGRFRGRPLEGELNLRRGQVKVGRSPGDPLEINTEGRVSLAEDLIRVTGLRATSQEAVLSLNGEHSIAGGRSRLEAELEAVPLDRLLDLFAVGGVGIESLDGRLNAEIMDDGTPRFEADVNGPFLSQRVRARIAGRLEQEDVLLESIDLTNPEVRISGNVRIAPSSGGVNGNFRVESSVLTKSLEAYGIKGMQIRGLRADGDLGGTFQAPEVRFQMGMDEFAYLEPLLEGLHAEGGYAIDKGLHLQMQAEGVPVLREAVESARITAGLHDGVVVCDVKADPSLTLSGRLKTEDLHTEVDFKTTGLDLSFLTEQWIRSASVLSVTGKGNFQGHADRMETWKGEAGIDHLECRFPDLAIRSTRPIEVRVRNGRLEGEASLEANGRPLSIQGTYPIVGEGGVRVEGSASLALEDFLLPARSFLPSLQAWKGDLELRGTLEGTSRSPRLRAVADLSEGSFQLGSPEERGQEPSPENGAEVTSYEDEAQQPEGIHSRSVRMHLELDGSVAEPAGSLEVHVREAGLYGLPLDAFLLEAKSRDGRMWKPHAELRSGKAELSMDGQWEVPTGAIAGDIRSTELDLGELLSMLDMQIEGTGRIQGTLGGTVGSPRVELRTDTESLTVQDLPMGSLHAVLVYEPAQLSLTGKTDTGWFEASMETEKEKAFSVRVSLEQLSVGPLLSAAGLRGWEGKASLSGELEGPATDMELWEGEVSLKELDVIAFEDRMRLEEPVSLLLSGGTLTVPETTLLIADSLLRINGSVGPKNNLAVKGTLPLRPFMTLIPRVHFHTGKVEADLEVRGSLASPSLEGRVRLEAEQVRVDGLAYPADSIRADLRAESSRFILESFTASVANGELTGNGAMSLKPLTFEDVQVSLRSVPIRVLDALVANLHGDITFQGNQENSSLEGILRIIEARYEEDFNLVGAVLLPTRPRRVTVQRADPFLKNMRLDLRVESGPNLFVRNNLGRLVLSTNMGIQGTAAKPVPLGIVRVEEGRIFYSNKRFDITQGSLAFSDPTGGQPRLQLESKAKIPGQSRDYLVYLSLMGPLDRIELELRSVPALEREDIIFVLLTGKTLDEYYAASEESADMDETAQRLAVSGIGLLFGSEIRAATGLDTFLMERTEGEEFGVKTTMGTQFNERIDVRGIFALGSGQQVSEAQVGYLLTDMFYVVGTQRTDGSFGLDFRVRIGNR
jgi:hypothetical protein